MSEEELPEGWAEARLGELGEWGTGSTPSKSRADYWGGTFPWVSPKDMKVDFIGEAQDHITRLAATEAAKLAPANALLFVVRGMILAHTFPVALTTREVAFNQDMRSIVPCEGIHAPYLLRVLQHKALWILHMVREATHGTLRLETETLAGWPMPVPPLAEQRRIVEKVEALLAEVNTARARLAKVPTILKRFRQSILSAACSGRLTEDWRDQVCEQEIDPTGPYWDALCRANGGARCWPIDEDRLAKFDDLPPNWKWIAASRCCDVRDGTHDSPKYHDRGVPLVTSKNLTEKGLDLTNVKFINETDHEEICRRSAVAEHDVLFAMIGTIGNPTVVRGDVLFSIKNVALFRTLGNAHLARWLALWLASPALLDPLREDAKGSSQPFVPLNVLRSLPIPMPPLPEQHEIVRRVDALFKLADAIEARVVAATARADKLTQAILGKALRGELVPTEAELARQEGRDYEPASALLARIRIERAADAPKPSRGRAGQRAPGRVSSRKIGARR